MFNPEGGPRDPEEEKPSVPENKTNETLQKREVFDVPEEKEDSERKDFIEERGELPIETFGTEAERSQNFNRFIQKFAHEREMQGITEENFKERLDKAKQFIENMPLLHATSIQGLVKIFESEKISSTFEIRKDDPEFGNDFSDSNTGEIDEKSGLDKFVFLSNKIHPYGDALVRVNRDVLNRPDCVVTAEDIMGIPERLNDFDLPREGWITSLDPDKHPEAYKETLKEYRQQAISGQQFSKFLAEFIASHHENPEEYISHEESEEYKQEKQEYKSRYQDNARVPLSAREWYLPEVKVFGNVTKDSIESVVIFNKKQKKLLIKAGVPENLIEISPVPMDTPEGITQINKSFYKKHE